MPYFDALLENSSEYIAAYTAVYEHVYPLALKGAADGVIVPAMRRRFSDNQAEKDAARQIAYATMGEGAGAKARFACDYAVPMVTFAAIEDAYQDEAASRSDPLRFRLRRQRRDLLVDQ